ncbi:MAG: BsuPI-related putative proteinase inhibitor [Eubacteriales bacterium]
MKNKIIRNIVTVLLLITLALPGLAYGDTNVSIMPISNVSIMPISMELSHWADKYVKQLNNDYEMQDFFNDKNLNDNISPTDFENLIQRTYKEDFEYKKEKLTRERAVYEFAKIWAEKTEQNLDNIATIKMLIYQDTTEIDPEYNHAVTVAYMKDIAQGRGDRIFDPNTELSYGEAATLVVNTNNAVEKELQNNKPIVEGKFETRADYKVTNENVEFNFELFSHFEESKEVMFSSGQQFEITVTDGNEEEVYKFSEGKAFTMAIVYETVEPGESLEWTDEWDRTDKEGNYLESGKYTAKVEILAKSPEEEDEEIDKDQLTKTINFTLYELNEDGRISPESAEKIIKDKATKIMEALKVRDIEILTEYVHPEKGLRFTPYTRVNEEENVVLSIEELKNFDTDEEYIWGDYDGKGDDIKLTPEEYYEEFVYTKDFLTAEQVGYNEVLSSGNMLENQFEIYDKPIIVEYYVPGEEFYNAWESLRLVFEEYEGNWKLVGIIHNQWTI